MGMQFSPFAEMLDPVKLFAMQNKQYEERLVMTDTLTAGQTKQAFVDVSNLGHFLCLDITGTFSTLYSDGAIKDYGINYLSGQLSDGGGNRILFNDKIPFQLWLTPGRRRDAASTTLLVTPDPIGNNLFVPMELQYLFTSNTKILLDVYNASNTSNSFEICFRGIRIVTRGMLNTAKRAMAGEY